MINAVIQGIINVVISLVDVLLTPIDALIDSALPSVSKALDLVGQFFSWVSNSIPWAISYFGFNDTILQLFVGYITLSLTLPLAVSTIKLALKWYNNLKI